MSSQRIVAVFGATGLQGSAVVDALLKDGSFVPRAISRDPESEASKKLKACGVEVVKGDPVDKASLVNALRGSEAVFAVTVPVFFHPNMENKNEQVQGTNMVDAAKEVGVKFFIWTSLPSITNLSGGKYKNVVHCDQKAAVQEYLKSSGLTHASLLLPAFLENYWTRGLLKRTATGYDISIPRFKPTDRESFAWVSRDVPSAALALLKNYTDLSKQINGKEYPVVSATMSVSELAAMTAKALGVEVTFTTAPDTGIPAIDEMFASHAEYSGLYAATPVPNPDLVALGMKFSTVEEFMETEVKPRFGQ
ncbi:hypothetical protein B0H13DRAFT_2401802 [Mycena leptocephala]|nr:hypothetical protein B0H13DRAFT_2401802 [Mycena leptocephala]